MLKVVVDSSVAVKWLNQHNEKLLTEAESVLLDAQSEKIVLLAPELTKYEIGNALLVSKKLSLSKVKEALQFFYSLPITFVPEDQKLSESTYQIGQKFNITYYDASFLSLAKQENAVLVTDNPKHQGKSKEVKVIPLADY